MSRHIVLMTDGLSQPGDFETLVGEIRSAGITVSTAAIGANADATLVQDIARWGNGSSHVTEDFAALPSILAQEALLLSDDPVQLAAFLPVEAAAAEFTENVSIPNLQGFVMTTERPAATVHYYADDEAPLLASWRFGLGRVAAFTSEGAGAWVAPWMRLESYPILWAQLVRWLTPSVAQGRELSVRRVGDELAIGVHGEGSTNIATVDGPESRRLEVELEATPAGFHSVRIPTWGPGIYTTTVAPAVEDEDSIGLKAAVHVSYPTSYDFSGKSFDELVWLTSISGGSIVGTLPDLDEPSRLWLPASAWPLWGVAALLLLLGELAVRYLLGQFAPPRTSRSAGSHELGFTGQPEMTVSR